jgi:hypothetical protein
MLINDKPFHEPKKLDPRVLTQFTGTERWHRHGLARNVTYNDGDRYVADTAGAYWLVLINRDRVLTEQTPEEFAEAWKFRLLKDDSMALNPWITYRVESFAPTESVTPTKPYQTRLKWHDLDGTDNSKLLLSDPTTALKVIAGEDDKPKPEKKRRVGPPLGGARATQKRRKISSCRS